MKKLNILTANNKTSKLIYTKLKQQTFSPDLTTNSRGLGTTARLLKPDGWSPARREAQELRKLNKKNEDKILLKKELKGWSVARRAAQLKAKRERDAQKLTGAELKARQPLSWSKARRAAQKPKPPKPITIDAEVEDVIIIKLDPALTAREQERKFSISRLHWKQSIKNSGLVNKKKRLNCTDDITKLKTLFNKTHVKRKNKQSCRQKLSTLKLKNVRSAHRKKEKHWKQLYFLWQKRAHRLKRKRLLRLLKIKLARLRSNMFQRQRYGGRYFTNLKKLVIARKLWPSRATWWFKKVLPWHNRWAVYLLYKLRNRLRLLDRLNYLLKDTLYFNYLHPIEPWEKRQNWKSEFFGTPARFVEALVWISHFYVDNYALRKRPYQFLIGAGGGPANEIFSPGDNYWKPDAFTDEDILDFTDEEISHYARGAFTLIKRRVHAVHVVVPPLSTKKRVQLLNKRQLRSRKSWRARLRAEFASTLLALLKVRGQTTGREYSHPELTGARLSEQVVSVEADENVHWFNYLCWHYRISYRLSHWLNFVALTSLLPELPPFLDRWGVYVNNPSTALTNSTAAHHDFAGTPFNFFRNIDTLFTKDPFTLSYKELAFEVTVNLTNVWPKIDDTFDPFIRYDIHPHLKLEQFFGAEPDAYALFLLRAIRAFGHKEKSKLAFDHLLAEAGGSFLVLEHSTTEDYLDDDETYFELCGEQQENLFLDHQQFIESILEQAEACKEEFSREKERKEKEKTARAARRAAARLLKPDGWSPARRLAYEKSKALREAAALSAPSAL